MGCSSCGGGHRRTTAQTAGAHRTVYRHQRPDGTFRDYYTKAEADAAKSVLGGTVIDPTTGHAA